MMAASPRLEIGRRLFAEPGVVVAGWYVAARSRQLGPGEVLPLELGNHRLVVWRDREGRAHVWEARCPHLGADLCQGQVVESGLRCVFHHWTFDSDGRTRNAPGYTPPPERQARALPVMERFGLVWVWAGSIATSDLPAFPAGVDEGQFLRLLPPPQHLACHPHLVIANGLDTAHFEALHGMRHDEEPVVEQDSEGRPSVRLCGRPRSALLRGLTGTGRQPLRARFTGWGPGLAWSTVESPFCFHTLYTARPLPDGGAETQLVLFLPKGPLSAPRSLVLLAILLHRDRQILERLRFHRGFADRDRSLSAFAEWVDGMEVFS